MKSFRTEINPTPGPFFIDHRTGLLAIGSCFADVIGRKLTENKFDVLANPFGTLYDPVSLHKSIKYALLNEGPLPSTYGENDGLWHNHDFHSSLSATTRDGVERNVMNAIGAAHHFIRRATVLIITYGTAFQYERNDTHESVANCHKLPANLFHRRLLTPEEIVASFDSLHQELKRSLPGIRFVVTVSPVRHIKDRIELNSASKSVLRWASYLLQERYPGVSYFPAFEIMMDDLRDYRFYAGDLLHPSDDAIQYIWEKFMETYMEPSTLALLQRWQKVLISLRHTPFHTERDVHRKFLAETLRQLEELNPLLPVEREISDLRLKILTAHER